MPVSSVKLAYFFSQQICDLGNMNTCTRIHTCTCVVYLGKNLEYTCTCTYIFVHVHACVLLASGKVFLRCCIASYGGRAHTHTHSESFGQESHHQGEEGATSEQRKGDFESPHPSLLR